MKYLCLLLLCVCSIPGQAQDDEADTIAVIAAAPAPALSISGYAEAYYTYDFGRPASGSRPSFLYSHNRHNEVNLNLAFLRAAYSQSRVRAALALMAGTYAQANLAGEPDVFRNVLEGWGGVQLSKKKALWLDAGILPSHIGFESAVSKDCPTLTRSLVAETSPYLEAGVRLSYTSPNERWYMAGLLLNGWQRIHQPPGNSTPAFGTQLMYRKGTTTLNWSTFAGNDKPDSLRRWRYFSNMYGVFTPVKKGTITLGFDAGAEQKAKGSSDLNTWYGLAVIAQYKPAKAWEVSARGEYYSDEQGVIVATNLPGGFKTSGWSLGVGYYVLPNALLRAEGKWYTGNEAFFEQNGSPGKDNGVITTSLAISF